MKDEGTNLSTMTQALKTVVTCEALEVVELFEGVCFGHAMNKACQYATTDDKVWEGLQPASIKSAQSAIRACIAWPKNSGKASQEWAKAYIDSGLRPRKMSTPVNTRFAFKVILFQQALQFRQAINLCYNR